MVARLLVLVLCFIPTAVWALGLGGIKLQSALNQPLKAEIKLFGVNPEEAESITASLGSQADFAQNNIARPYWVSKLKFKLVNQGDASYISVTTRDSMSEPYVSFLMVVDSPSGRLSKQYTVLLDPPVRPVSAQVLSQNANSRSNTTDPYANVARVDYSGGGTYGPIRPGDTLHRIAKQLLPGDGSINTQQMMIGLLQANPQAFINQNINLIKVGRTLVVPTQFPDRSSAAQSVSEQIASWRSGRSSDVDDTDHLVVEAPTASDTAMDSEVSTAPSAASQRKVKSLQKKLEAANETAASRSMQVKELNAKLKQLEKQASLMRQKLSLRDEQIKKLTAKQEAMAEQLAKPITAEQTAKHVKPVTDTVEDSSDDIAIEDSNDDVAIEDSNDDVAIEDGDDIIAEDGDDDIAIDDDIITEDGDDEIVTEDGDDEIVTEDGDDDIVTEDDGDNNVAIENGDDVAAADDGEQGIETAVDTDQSGGMNMMALAAGGVGGLLGLGAVFWFFKRRNSGAIASDSEQDSYIPDSTMSTAADTNSVFADVDNTVQDSDTLTGMEEFDSDETAALGSDEEEVKRPNFEDTAILSVEDTAIFEGDDTAILDELMPNEEFDGSDSLIPEEGGGDGILSEADIALAYGNYDQAEELLKSAIADHPSNHDYQAKLLEVYHASGNADAFAEGAAALHVALGGQGGATWQNVERMGREVCPDNPLFASASAADVDATMLADDDDFAMDITEDDGTELDLGFDMDDVSTADDLDMDMATTADDSGELDLSNVDEDDFDLSELGLDDVDFGIDEEEVDNPFMSDDDDDDVGNSTMAMSTPAEEDFTSDDLDGLDLDDSELLDLSEDLGLDLELEDGEDSESIDLDFGDDFEGLDDDAAAIVDTGAVPIDDLGDSTQVFEFDESDEVGTKLDLARAYIDMGDSEGARGILDEVIHEGNEQQKHEAEVLMRSIT